MFILKEEKQKKDDIPTIFAWRKAVKVRPPPKEHTDPIVSTPRFHSIGINVKIHSDNHVSTCCRDLIEMTIAEKEVLVKPAVTIEAATNTLLVETSDVSTQTEGPRAHVMRSDVSTMTDEDDHQSTPLRIEQIQDNQKCVQFYTGFVSFQMLMVCFNFLGSAVSELSYGDHHKHTNKKPHKLTPFK